MGWVTYFQTKLKRISAERPSKAPNQSIFPSLSTADSGGSTIQRAVYITTPSPALQNLVNDIIHYQHIKFTCIVKKKYLHSAHWMNIPINTQPDVPPTGAANPKNPNVKLRNLLGGKVIPISATTLGITMAAPIPLIARATAKEIMLWVQNPLVSVQTIHHIPPTNRTFLWP